MNKCNKLVKEQNNVNEEDSKSGEKEVKSEHARKRLRHESKVSRFR